MAKGLPVIGIVLVAALNLGAGQIKIEPDKVWHFLGSTGMTGGMYGLNWALDAPRDARVVNAVLFSLAVGATRELTGNKDKADFAADVLGTILGLGISIFVDLAVHGDLKPDPRCRWEDGLHICVEPDPTPVQ